MPDNKAIEEDDSMGFVKAMKESAEVRKLNKGLEATKKGLMGYMIGRYGLGNARYYREKEECVCEDCGKQLKGEITLIRGNGAKQCRGCARKLINKASRRSIDASRSANAVDKAR